MQHSKARPLTLILLDVLYASSTPTFSFLHPSVHFLHPSLFCLSVSPASLGCGARRTNWLKGFITYVVFFFFHVTYLRSLAVPCTISLIVILSREVSVMRMNCVFGVRGAERGVGRDKDWMMKSVCDLGILQTNRKHRPTSRWTRTENRKADRLPFILLIISSFCAQNQSGLGLVISQWTGKVSYFVGCRELGEQKHFFSSLCISASLCGRINCAAVRVCKPSLNEMYPLFTAPLSR